MAVSQPTSDEGVTVEFVAEGLDPVIGLTLDGRFRVVGSVGKGAMGTVYKAVQEPLNRTVALKVLDSNYGAGRDETFRQRFLVEAALTAKLSHPNTVRIIDYGCTKDGLFYLAMEYLAGLTLDRVLAHGGLSWRRVAAIALQVARALREAHDLGVVHRDLKPANIMVLTADNDADHVKVLDFGLVKSFVEGRELEGRAITQHGMLMGSPPYMAPEQGDKNRADPRSDIYSLGIVMFEALTGKPPFTGNAPLEIILKHVNQVVPPLRAPLGVEPIPEAMVALVNKCLAKSPMDRFQSMDELIAGLQTLTAPVVTPSTVNEVPALSDFIDVPPRHRTGLLAVGFLAALVIGIAGTALVLQRKPEVEPRPVPAVVAAPIAAEVPQPRVEPVSVEPEPKADLAPAPVHFHVDSSPRGARTEHAGLAYVTPFNLDVGTTGDSASLELKLTLAGYEPLRVSASGKPHDDVQMKPTLQRLPQPEKEKRRPALIKKAARAKAKPVIAKPASKLIDDDEPIHVPQNPPPGMGPAKHEYKDDLKRPAPQ